MAADTRQEAREHAVEVARQIQEYPKFTTRVVEILMKYRKRVREEAFEEIAQSCEQGSKELWDKYKGRGAYSIRSADARDEGGADVLEQMAAAIRAKAGEE
jgi:hypothetical protein